MVSKDLSQEEINQMWQDAPKLEGHNSIYDTGMHMEFALINEEKSLINMDSCRETTSSYLRDYLANNKVLPCYIGIVLAKRHQTEIASTGSVDELAKLKDLSYSPEGYEDATPKLLETAQVMSSRMREFEIEMGTNPHKLFCFNFDMAQNPVMRCNSAFSRVTKVNKQIWAMQIDPMWSIAPPVLSLYLQFLRESTKEKPSELLLQNELYRKLKKRTPKQIFGGPRSRNWIMGNRFKVDNDMYYDSAYGMTKFLAETKTASGKNMLKKRFPNHRYFEDE